MALTFAELSDTQCDRDLASLPDQLLRRAIGCHSPNASFVLNELQAKLGYGAAFIWAIIVSEISHTTD